MPKTYLLLICELTRSIWPVGCKGPRHHTSLGMPSQVPCPAIWRFCWGTWNICPTSQRLWQTLKKAFTGPVTFPDNPEQCINGEVYDQFMVNATVLLGTPQSAPTAVRVLHTQCSKRLLMHFLLSLEDKNCLWSTLKGLPSVHQKFSCKTRGVFIIISQESYSRCQFL